jgi:hypothetical protein
MDTLADRMHAEAENRNSHGEFARSGAAVWKTAEGTNPGLSEAQKNAVANVWYGDNYAATNAYLRRGAHPSAFGATAAYGVGDEAYEKDIDTFRQAVSTAEPFKSEVQLYRGVNFPDRVFGSPGTMTGSTFTDKGFTSATSNDALAHQYGALPGSRSALVVIHAPAGSRALKVDTDVWKRAKTHPGQTPPAVLQEYTFAPGSYRVLSDTVAPSGARTLHMEVTG